MNITKTEFKYSTYLDDVLIRHEYDSIPIIMNLIMEFKPELFIEIGTKYGGVTYLVHNLLPECELHTWDIEDLNVQFDFINKYIGDCFDDAEKIIELCKRPERKILYCDGGDKTREMIDFGSNLNKGDIMGCHDWNEIRRNEVRNKFNLKPYHDFNKRLEEKNVQSRFFIISD